MVKKNFPPFQGLSRDSFEFMAELGANNNRQWFEQNRERWESVRDQLCSVCVALTPFVTHLDPGLETEPKSGRCLGRINRDTRFSADKHPYRDYVDILFFPSAHRRTTAPGLAVGLTSEFCYIGTWRGAQMEDWRARFLANVTALPDIFERYAQSQDNFKAFWLEGQSFTRSRAKGLPPLADQWTRRKFYYMGLTVPAAEVASAGDSILETVERTFARLYPLYLFNTSERLAADLEAFKQKFPEVRL
ncbi:DUF2461 domain-containing protein [bacterium]|nr:DUF2461 domain-containing protein [bacterium]